MKLAAVFVLAFASVCAKCPEYVPVTVSVTVIQKVYVPPSFWESEGWSIVVQYPDGHVAGEWCDPGTWARLKVGDKVVRTIP